MSEARPNQCPFHSRAQGAQCDLDAGHESAIKGKPGWCVMKGGDCFASGWDPRAKESTEPANGFPKAPT